MVSDIAMIKIEVILDDRGFCVSAHLEKEFDRKVLKIEEVVQMLQNVRDLPDSIDAFRIK